MRRLRDSPSSFDLLLDTITNTFGGVLFLAILLAVLLRFGDADQKRHQQVDDASRLELVELERELTETLSTFHILQMAQDRQESLARYLVRNMDQGELERLRQLTRRRDELIRGRLEAVKTVGVLRNQINHVASDVERLETDLDGTRHELLTLTAALRTELDARTVKATLPKVRLTFKREVGLVLRYGRLYEIHSYDQLLIVRSLNTDDMVVVSDGLASVRVTPKPYAGTPVTEDTEFAQNLSQRMKRFDPDLTYVAIAVWDDSFGQFAILKDSLVQLGFEYRLIPMEKGETLVESHGSESLVQ